MGTSSLLPGSGWWPHNHNRVPEGCLLDTPEPAMACWAQHSISAPCLGCSHQEITSTEHKNAKNVALSSLQKGHRWQSELEQEAAPVPLQLGPCPVLSDGPLVLSTDFSKQVNSQTCNMQIMRIHADFHVCIFYFIQKFMATNKIRENCSYFDFY